MSHSSQSCSFQSAHRESEVTLETESPTPCYFMVADILGFSRMIQNLDDHRQAKRISDWIEVVETTRSQCGVLEIQLISDTLFARETNSVEGLSRLISFAQLLLEHGSERFFPIRGAIVYGDAAWGRLTYGKAVILAHEIERSLDWIGIAVAPWVPEIDLMWDWDMVVCYPVPRKGGPTQLLPAVSWKVPDVNELVRRVTGMGLLSAGDQITWEIISKIERTVQFGMYLRMGKAKCLEPQQYRGWFPMHALQGLYLAED